MCPTNTSIPVEVSGLIPLAESDIEGIPALAYSIPDFEGQAMLRIFSNLTTSEIACYSAMVTNGNTMSHPGPVGGILGVITFGALLASFASAAYGKDIANTRKHYARSPSIFVVFAVLQHVFFTGALSLNWPSVLPAFWSNFAWSAGMIYLPSMQASINKLMGNNFGNTSAVGAASLGASDNTGGGYRISEIYRRTLAGLSGRFARDPELLIDILGDAEMLDHSSLTKRTLENATTGFYWYGSEVGPGLPIPGNFSGLAGTLSFEQIPASNAFLTGFIWLLIFIAILVAALVVLKFMLDISSTTKLIRVDRLELFRRYWIGFTAMAVARTCFIAFFMIMFLCLFQFAYGGPAAAKAVAAVVFVIFGVCVFGISALSCYYRVKDGSFEKKSDRLHLEGCKVLGIIPWLTLKRESIREKEGKLVPSIASIPWFSLHHNTGNSWQNSVHDDEAYIRRYAWLVSRHRKNKWWFASFWLAYEFIRAIFYGGAAGHPSTQVFGLLVVEFIGLVAIVKMKPFESTRLNVLMVYLLGFSKVITVALSSAFHPQFGLPRITAAAIAFVIIVIQGLLLIIMIIFIIVGMFSTYLSLTRDRQISENDKWMKLRTRYLKHVDLATDDASENSPVPVAEPEVPQAPHFNLSSARRVPKIEDQEDKDAADYDPYGSRISVVGQNNNSTAHSTRRTSRTDSVYSTMSFSNLPYGARPSRQSWSTRDIPTLNDIRRHSSFAGPSTDNNTKGDLGTREGYATRPRNRAQSFGSASTLEVRKTRANTFSGKAPALNEEPGEDARPSTDDIISPVEEAK